MLKLLGTLLPLTALKNEAGERDLFSAGYEFVDWLVKTKQTAWQLLPIHQLNWKNDRLFGYPYSGFGIGINPLLGNVGKLEKVKGRGFVDDWVEDYALFLALSDEFKTDKWYEWPEDIQFHKVDVVEKWRTKLSKKVDLYVDQQLALLNEYWELKRYANERGIQIIGDVPFYLGIDSPLVWCYQDVFEIKRGGKMDLVSGCLPELHFPRQVWGHPLYRWDSELKKILNLFKLRLEFANLIYDWTRIDHVIGFYQYGMMDIKRADNDRLGTGPGNAALLPLVDFCRQKKMKIFVENVGGADQIDLQRTMRRLELPGMTLLSLASVKNGVVNERIFEQKRLRSKHFYFSSNHDTETWYAFVRSLSIEKRKSLAVIMGVKYVEDFRQLAEEMLSWLVGNARFLVVPIQDWLGSEERINVPGDVTRQRKNWKFQLPVRVKDLPESLFNLK